MPATPRRPGTAVAMAPLSELALELALLAALLALEEALLARLAALLEDLLALLAALLDSLLMLLDMLLEAELSEEEAEEPPVKLLRAEPVGGVSIWVVLGLLCVEGREVLLGALVALEMMEPALVMEERRPPPVDSWAATMEPAAMTRMDVNFMVMVWLVLLLLVVGCFVELLTLVSDCVEVSE